MAKDKDVEAQKGQIPTNLRLLFVLEEVARAGVPVPPSHIAETLDLPKATIHRLLATAEEEGFLQRDVDGRSYGPGPRLRRVATNTLSSQRIRSERLRILRNLAEKVGETCNLAAPDRDGMVYLDRVETHWPLRIQLPIGTQVPFHCTASGKMYLSTLTTAKLDRLLANMARERRTERTLSEANALKEELSRTRKRGYALDDQEFMDGMTAIAVAVRDDRDRLLSTLSMHAPIQRLSVEQLVQYLPILRAAADQLHTLALE